MEESVVDRRHRLTLAQGHGLRGWPSLNPSPPGWEEGADDSWPHMGVMGAPRKLPAQVTESQDSHFTASHTTQEGAPSHNVPSPGRRVPVTLAGGGWPSGPGLSLPVGQRDHQVPRGFAFQQHKLFQESCLYSKNVSHRIKLPKGV